MVTPRTGSIAALLAALSALAAGGCEQGPSVQEVEVPAPPAPGGAEAGYRELPGHWVLLSAGGFFGRTIGAGAACSDEAAAFRMLLARPDAAAAFKDLLERARLGGQLYGLCGLWHTDPVAFRAALPRYAASRELLTVQWYGCLVDRRPVGELVRAEGPAVARLDGPGDSVAAWARRQGMAEDASPQLDIEGGGFPAVLAAPDERDAANAAEAREALAALASSDAEKRILGAEGIAGLRSAGLLDRAPAAARACGALLSDPDEAVREAGLRALEQLGAWSAGALPALRAFLERDASTEDPEEALERTVRCVDLLGWIGPRAAGDLERLLAHEHPFVRAEALEALGRMARFAGVSAETFARRLEDGSEEVRAAAALALGWLGAEGRAAAARLRSLGGDPSPLVRLRAGVALWRVAREPPREALQLLEIMASMGSDLLHDDVGALRDVLGEAARESRAVRTEVLGALDSGAAGVRLEALEVVARLGPEGRDALPALRRLAGGGDLEVREAAAEAIWLVAGDPGPAVAPLLEEVRDGERTRRIEAARALGQYGPAAREQAAPALLEALSAGDLGLVRAALGSLRAVEADLGPAGPALVRLLRGGARREEALRLEIIDALGAAGAGARGALPGLREALEDSSREVQDAARAAIARIEGAGGGAR